MIQQKKDLLLLIKIKDGNKKAETKIYNYYKNKIAKFIFNKYPLDNYKEDNVSEILIKVFENINKYSERKSQFSTWVLTIAKNHMIDKGRKKQPIYVDFNNNMSGTYELTFTSNSTTFFTTSYDNKTFASSDMGHFLSTTNEPISFNPLPDYNLEISDSINYISNNSTNVDFSMMLMKYKDGYSYDEIGKEFNMSCSKVRNKINYVKNKIKKKNNSK